MKLFLIKFAEVFIIGIVIGITLKVLGIETTPLQTGILFAVIVITIQVVEGVCRFLKGKK